MVVNNPSFLVIPFHFYQKVKLNNQIIPYYTGMSVEDYKRFMEAQGRNQNTVKAYANTAKRLLEFAGKPASSIGEEDVVGFLALFEKSSSKARHVYGLRDFLRYAGNPEAVERIKAPTLTRQLEWWLKPEHVQLMIQRTPLPRDRAIIALSYAYALRRGEVSILNRSDVDRDRMSITLRSLKKRRGIVSRTVSLYPEVLSILDEYLRNRKDSEEALFTTYDGNRMSPDSISAAIRRAVERVGIEPKGSNRNLLRHARASYLRLQGVDIADIKDFLNHERIDTTMIYSHIAPTELHERIPPPNLK